MTLRRAPNAPTCLFVSSCSSERDHRSYFFCMPCPIYRVSTDMICFDTGSALLAPRPHCCLVSFCRLSTESHLAFTTSHACFSHAAIPFNTATNLVKLPKPSRCRGASQQRDRRMTTAVAERFVLVAALDPSAHALYRPLGASSATPPKPQIACWLSPGHRAGFRAA